LKSNFFFRNQKGNANTIIGLAVIMTGVMMFALIFDIGYLYVRREAIKQALDFSNMAVYKEVDTGKLADGKLYINETPGQNTFLAYLQSNLKLDGSLKPLPGSMASGQVTVVSFEIYNQNELPATDSTGNIVEEVSVHSRIIMPVQPVFSGLFTSVNLPVAITTDIPDGVLD